MQLRVRLISAANFRANASKLCKTRSFSPLPEFEDKVLQRGNVMLLEPVYEAEFLDCSYGYRPGRSAHQALEAIWKQTMDIGGCWMIDADTA